MNVKYSVHEDYKTKEGISLSSKKYIVKEHSKTHTGVRWLTIQNIVAEFDTLKECNEFIIEQKCLNS